MVNRKQTPSSSFLPTFSKLLDPEEDDSSGVESDVILNDSAVGVNYETSENNVDICINKRTLNSLKGKTSITQNKILLQRSFCVSANTLPVNSSHCQIHVCGSKTRSIFFLIFVLLLSNLCVHSILIKKYFGCEINTLEKRVFSASYFG